MIKALPYILIAMIFYGIGEYYAKIYANTNILKFAIISWVGYAINAIFFYPAMKCYNSLAILGSVWNIAYVILTLFLGVIIFQETVTTKQIIGLVFGFISIILLST